MIIVGFDLCELLLPLLFENRPDSFLRIHHWGIRGKKEYSHTTLAQEICDQSSMMGRMIISDNRDLFGRHWRVSNEVSKEL